MYPVYLIGILDDHSRYLVGWGLFRQQNADAVLEVLKGAIGQWGAPREILSDNGRQFVAWRGETRFQKVLRQQGVQHVRSAPQHPMTLGKIERFWQTIWREFLEEAVFASFADACRRLEHWIHYFNHQRPHQGLDGACPADRFTGSQATWKRPYGRVARTTRCVWPWVRSRSRRCICWDSWAVRMCAWCARGKRSRSRWAMRCTR
jgi:transposase InsO family protein